MRFRRILSVCLGLLFVAALQVNVNSGALGAGNSLQNPAVLDGGHPLPPPTLADGGHPLPPPYSTSIVSARA